MTPVESEELLREKSLFDVYRAARVLKVSRVNQGVSFLTFLTALAYGVASPESDQAIAEKARALADYGFSFATSILSFLIAGFTIYLSVTKTELMVFLASQRDEATGLPELKKIAFYFLRTMANFILFCLLCVGIKVFASAGGPMSLLLKTTLADPSATKQWLAALGFSVVAAGLVHLLMLLWSFVFNIYQTAMIAVVWERE